MGSAHPLTGVVGVGRALLLAAGELPRLAAQVFLDLNQVRHLSHPLADRLPLYLLIHQGKALFCSTVRWSNAHS